jgi:peptidoglycan lytic transglycosylase
VRRALTVLAGAAVLAGAGSALPSAGAAQADESCNATYYDQGTRTASGEPFDPEAMTAAHRTLPFGTVVQVTDTDNGKVVTVRINDRGPFAADRCIDLTRAAFERLAPTSRGVIPVLLDITGTAAPPARDLARDLAARILADRRITLATAHSDLRGDDPPDGASAHDDVADTAQGRPARRSSYGGAAGGTVRLSAAMLQGMLDVAAAAALHVSEIAGGPYGPQTSHARGAAFDVDGVDGRPVLFLGGAELRVMDACRAHGATEVRYEGLHIHCGWS